jgi:hypothetical protein
MDAISAFSSWSWQDQVTAIGIIATIISAIITIFSYLDQRRSSKNIKPLIESEKLKLDWDISQEKLKDSQDKLKNVEDQLNTKIPALARIFFLKNQAEFLSDAIGRSYSELKKIEKELNSTQSEIVIDKSIETAILDLIPEYDRQKKRNALKDRITILGIALVFFNNILPNIAETLYLSRAVYLITQPGQIVAAILLLGTIFQLYTMDKEYQKTINKYASTLFYSSVLAFLLFIGLLMILFLGMHEWELGILLGIFELTMVILLYYLYTKGELDNFIRLFK